MNCTRVYFGSFVFLLYSAHCFAQDVLPPFPIDDKDPAGHFRLSAVLEDDFTKMLLKCLPGQSSNKHLTVTQPGKYWGETKAETTAIPESLQSALPIKTTFVNGPFGQSIASLFTYIFSDNEKQTGVISATNPARRIEIPIDGSIGLPNAQYDGAHYGETCASAITGKLSLSGGYSLPIFDVKAAIASDTDSSSSWSLNLLSGQFYSPIPDVFSKFDINGIYARLVLWKWYYDRYKQGDVSILTTKYHVLYRFRGMSVYQVYGDKGHFSVNANAAVKLALPFLGMDAAWQGKYDNGVDTRIQSFQTMAYVDSGSLKSDADWYPLPTVNDMAGTPLFGLSALREKVGAFLVKPGVKHVQHQIVQGVPSVNCSSALWVAEGMDGQSVPGLTIKGVSQENTEPAIKSNILPCAFEVEYIVPNSLQQTHSLTLEYHLVMKINNEHKLKIQAAPATLVTPDGPLLSPDLFTPNFKANDIGRGNQELDWTVKLIINETPGSVIVAGSQPTGNPDMVLQCGAASYGVLIKNIMLQAGNPKRLQVDIAKIVSPAADHLNLNGATADKCALTGTINFDLGNNVVVPRQIATSSTLILDYPPLMPPAFGVSPPVQFSTNLNSNPLPQSISISNSGGGTLSWQASIKYEEGFKPWLTVNPLNGTAPGNLTVSANSTGLTQGNYKAQVLISGSGISNTMTVPVSLTINTPPPAVP